MPAADTMNDKTISKVMRLMAQKSVEKRKQDIDKFHAHLRLMTERARVKNTKPRCECGMMWGHTGKHRPVDN